MIRSKTCSPRPGGGRYRIHLDANESFLPLPSVILEELAQTLPQTAFNRYPDPAARELCQAFAQYYGVPVENVAAGNGSDELITVLFTGFLQRGDAFATVEPDFSMYAFNGHLQETRHICVPKREDYSLDIDKLIETCQNENVKLLIFSNPGNPTSVVCPREEICRLVRGVDALVVLDEAYMDFSDQSLLPEFSEYDNLLILRTCSKAIGMAGARLGFAVGQKPLIDAVKAVNSYNVNTLSQNAGHSGAASLPGPGWRSGADPAVQGPADFRIEALGKEYPDRFTLPPCATNFAAMKDSTESACTIIWGESGASPFDIPEACANYLRHSWAKIRRCWRKCPVVCHHTGSGGGYHGTLRIHVSKNKRNRSHCGTLPGWGREKRSTGVGSLTICSPPLRSMAGLAGKRLATVGDWEVDCHHTIEDMGIVLKGLCRRIAHQTGIKPFGHAFIPG